MSLTRVAETPMPSDVDRFEQRVRLVRSIRRHLPGSLGWLTNPLAGSAARLSSQSHIAAYGPCGSEAATHRHAAICERGGHAMVNGQM